MATAEPIPVLLCGKIPGHIQASTEIVKPELQDAKTTISESFSGSPAAKPRLIIMGGGYSQDDFSSIYESVDGAKGVPWIRPVHFKEGGAPAGPPKGPPSAEAVAGRLRKTIDEHLAELNEGKGEGEIWWM